MFCNASPGIHTVLILLVPCIWTFKYVFLAVTWPEVKVCDSSCRLRGLTGKWVQSDNWSKQTSFRPSALSGGGGSREPPEPRIKIHIPAARLCLLPGNNSPCATAGSGWLRSPPSAAPYRPAAASREAASRWMTSQKMDTKNPTKRSDCHRDQSPRSRMKTCWSHRPLARSTVTRKRWWSDQIVGMSHSAPCWEGGAALRKRFRGMMQQVVFRDWLDKASPPLDQ